MTCVLGRFGDLRLQKGGLLLARLVSAGQGGVRVRALGGDRAGTVRLGRFLRNRRVTPNEMARAAFARVAALARGRHVLAIQDTTSLRDDGDQRSLHLHPTIAVDAGTGALLGLVDAQFLRRAAGKRANTGGRRFDDKESRRWLDATIRAAALAEARAACVTVAADREGGNYTVDVALRYI